MHIIEKYLIENHNYLWGQLFIKDLIPEAIKAIEEYKMCEEKQIKNKWCVIKHRLGGYCVQKNDKMLGSIFRLKRDAKAHMNNLIKVEESVSQFFKEIPLKIKKR